MNEKKIGLKCKMFRKNLGIKQEQVANEIGCTQSLVSQFENDKCKNLIIFLWYLEHGLEVKSNG